MKKYTQEKLNEVVRLNELFHRTGGEEGERADLSNADLTDAKHNELTKFPEGFDMGRLEGE